MSSSSNISKAPSFFFGSRTSPRARLHFRQTHSNLFVTLTDLSNKVVSTMSGGRCFSGNKRPKKAPQALEPMVAGLVPCFKQYRLKACEIWLKSPYNWHVQMLLKELSVHELSVFSIEDKCVAAHNGVRGRKPRRV